MLNRFPFRWLFLKGMWQELGYLGTDAKWADVWAAFVCLRWASGRTQTTNGLRAAPR